MNLKTFIILITQLIRYKYTISFKTPVFIVIKNVFNKRVKCKQYSYSILNAIDFLLCTI